MTDGEENPIRFDLLHEVRGSKYVYPRRLHTYEPALVIVDQRWFEGLNPKYQAILKDAANLRQPRCSVQG